ncbi:hypothetical protein KAR04_09645 [Candidatus Calescamantes bacterium]|nr:hypothetical protein [Candidatus Calescamantes bacterium]
MESKKYFDITKKLVVYVLWLFILLLISLFVLTNIFEGSETITVSGNLYPSKMQYIKDKDAAVIIKDGERVIKGQSLIAASEIKSTDKIIIAEINGEVHIREALGKVREIFIYDPDSWEAEVFIPENQLNRINTDLQTIVLINALSHMDHGTIDGRLAKIGRVPMCGDMLPAIFYNSTVSLSGDALTKMIDNRRLFPGMSVKCRIVLKRDKVFKLFYDKMVKKVFYEN